MSPAFRIAARELRGGLKAGLRGFRVFLACLALGVAAIAALGSVRVSIETGLAREGATILGGDAEMTFTYRYAEADERAWMEETARGVSEIVDFRSMAVVERGEDDERALTQVKSVDGFYPLKGAVVLDPPLPLAEALAPRDGLPGGVMERALADRLGLAPGDTFRLGLQEFRLTAILAREPDAAGDGFGFGPRTIVLTEALARSELLVPGTLFETKYRLDLPEGADLASLEAEAEGLFRDQGARWLDARNGAPGVSEFVERLSSFLVLVGLAGLAVGGVGVAAAVRAYLSGKMAVIATLKTIGAEGRTIFAAYFLQIGALAGLGILIGLALGAALPLLAAPFVTDRLPIPAEISVYPRPLAEAALYGVLSALLFTLWPLARAEEVRAAALYREGAGQRIFPRARYIVATFLLLAALVGTAAFLADSPRLALWSAGGIASALMLLALAGQGARWLARRAAQARVLRGRTALRLALGAIGGRGSEAMPVVLSLGLGLSVLAAVGQIDWNLRNAIATELPDVAPSYFVIDIQPDQIESYLARLEGDPGVKKIDTAPMLRGIITEIDGRPAEEVAGDHWVIRSDRGVTYSATLPADTTLTEGEWWPEDYAGEPLVSFAAEEAAEMGLRIGDTITVNILGRDIEARIASFRVVDFSTAGIGFVMSMNPAALRGAPHSFISTIYAAEEAETRIVRDLAEEYPNITAIRIREVVGYAAGILASIAAAITYGAAASLITGAIVLIGAAAAGERARVFEAAVLKTVGAARATVLASFALRSAMLGAVAGAVAIAAGGLAGWAVMRFVMEGDYVFEPVSAIAIVTGGALVTLFAGLGFAWRPLALRPARVLRAPE
jgi:putative ABC transport system permease protein